MPPEDDKNYEVGYKKPPESGQFKPGQSGNPKGRPKRSRNLCNALAEELDSLIHIKEGGERREITKAEAMIKQMVNKAMSGDLKTASFIFEQLNHIQNFSVVDSDDSMTVTESISDEEAAKQYYELMKECSRGS